MRFMKIRNLFCLLGLLIWSGCETTPPAKETNAAYAGATFEVQVPPSVNVTPNQGDEFAVHYFRVGQSKTTMGIYEGQRPKLFSRKERDLTVMHKGSTVRGNIQQGSDAWGVDSNAKIWRESVWNAQRTVKSPDGKSYRLPTMIHIWYFGATEEEQTVFDSIVDTLEVK